jgi:hypothetical protein
LTNIKTLMLLTLFFPQFSIDAANEKFAELMPFRRGILGAATSLVATFLIGMFCILGIAIYFEQPKKKDSSLSNNADK